MLRLKLIIRRAMLKKLALVIVKAGTLVSRKVALKVANSIYLLKVLIKNIEVELKLNKMRLQISYQITLVWKRLIMSLMSKMNPRTIIRISEYEFN